MNILRKVTKEIITIELSREEIKDAITKYLNELECHDWVYSIEYHTPENSIVKDIRFIAKVEVREYET